MTFKNEIVIEEFFGPSHNSNTFRIDNHGNLCSKTSRNGSVYSVKEFFKTVFLPENYPYSVSDDYLNYQIWDTLQAFCSSVSGALATRAMFQSIGVGDEAATAYGATLTWLIKDGTGMVGRICFAWYQGTFLDSDSKMWRLYADILNDFSFFVDLLTPILASEYSIYCISFSGLLKSIVGIAGGATRSALTQHQAIRNNLADVSAKDSSQETLVNLVALVFNLIILNYVKDSIFLIWPLFIFFVIGHIYCNYNAVKSVTMKTFNRNRFHILAQHYLRYNSQILDTNTVNKLEPVLSPCRRCFSRIRLGCSLNYFTSLEIRSGKEACVALTNRSDDKSMLKALFQIEIVEFLMTNLSHGTGDYEKLSSAIQKKDEALIAYESFRITNSMFPKFLQQAGEANWSFAYTQFSPNIFRYSLDQHSKQA